MKGFRFIICLGLFLAKSAFAMLPVDFITATPLANLPVGQPQLLSYTIRNNVKTQALPISISIVNDGDLQPNQAIFQTNTCPAFLPPHGTCTITVAINGLKPGLLRRHLNIDYQGRAPLTAPLVNSEVGIANYTILVYMVGSDLESGSGAYASRNIAQMQQIGSTANMNVVLETGGAQKVGWLTVKRQLVQRGQSLVLSDLGQVNMANPATIQDFITWGIRTFPAKKYILVFWDHAGGANGGFGGDENFKVDDVAAVTPTNQVISAVKGALSATNTVLELVGFDACLMGSAEVASGFAPYARYYVGSEDVEPGGGWQYNTFLNYVTSNLNASGLDIGKIIVDGFTEHNLGQTTTLSVLELSQLPHLVDAVNAFSSALSNYTNSTAENWKTIARSRLSSADYNTSVWIHSSSDVTDLINFVGNIQAAFPSDLNLSAACEAVITAVQNTVKYFKNSSNRASSLGLTTYFPSIMRSYVHNYANNISLDGVNFYSANYSTQVQNYYQYYLANISALAANFSNMAHNGSLYTATLSNDYAQLYAAVGSQSCPMLIGGQSMALPCLSTLQFSTVTATSAGGTAWDLSYNVTTHQNSWPLINNTPTFLIDSDVNPQTQEEQTFLIPVTQIYSNPNNNTTGFLQLNRSNGNYTVIGFIESLFVSTSTNSVSKVTEINNGDQFYLRAYALSNAEHQCYNGSTIGTWCLLDTENVVTAPLTITANGTLPPTSLYNQFAFFAADLTGALPLSAMLSYP